MLIVTDNMLSQLCDVCGAGRNCSERLQTVHYSVSRYMFQCEVSLTSRHVHLSVDDIVKAMPYFDAVTG